MRYFKTILINLGPNAPILKNLGTKNVCFENLRINLLFKTQKLKRYFPSYFY